MRTLIWIALCACTLAACGDTHQAAPVDEVSAHPLAAPSSHHPRSVKP